MNLNCTNHSALQHSTKGSCVVVGGDEQTELGECGSVGGDLDIAIFSDVL